MNVHKNARLTPAGRALLVQRVVTDRQPVPAVAAQLGVSARTVRKWIHRWQAEGAAGLADRPSRPRRSPTALRRTPRRQIAKLRRRRWSSPRIARHLRLAVPTVGRVLRQLGLNRLARLEPPRPVVRYERARPGELLHLDVKKLGRIVRVGHRITGDRRGQSTLRSQGRGVGWEYLHVALDDHSRLTYAELLPDERSATAVAFLARAARWVAAQGIARFERVMTDNGSAYVSHAFRRAVAALGARHLRTRPYRPQTNGKAERVIQTLLREWAYAQAYRTSLHRALALGPYLTYYNTQRPHTALRGLTPQHRLAQGTTS